MATQKGMEEHDVIVSPQPHSRRLNFSIYINFQESQVQTFALRLG